MVIKSIRFSDAPFVPLSYTFRAPLVYLSCPTRAPLVRLCPNCVKMKNTVSTLVLMSAPLVPISWFSCPSRAPLVHILCTSCAPLVHILCTFGASDPTVSQGTEMENNFSTLVPISAPLVPRPIVPLSYHSLAPLVRFSYPSLAPIVPLLFPSRAYLVPLWLLCPCLKRF